MYWISTLVFALVLTMILGRDIRIEKKPGKVERAFQQMLAGVIYFCLQDTVWGLCAGEQVTSRGALFAASTVFHASTVLTTFFWVNYVLCYLGDRLKHRRRYLVPVGLTIVAQVGLLIANFFTPTIFYVDASGAYATAFLRVWAFMNQYIVYVCISVAAAACAYRAEGEKRRRYIKVFFFALAPVLSGVFQYLYPDGPFYSLGYFLSCVSIHLFIVSEERDDLVRLQNERRMADQMAIAHTDGLTGLYNRRAYEDDLQIYPKVPVEENYVYVSADVNGLKEINDAMGHAAGDELLRCAAACLSRCLGAYGKIYRIGGDEFAAMIFADEAKLEFIRQDVEQELLACRGPGGSVLSVSIGYAARREFEGAAVTEIARIADERMYKAKAEWYLQRGIDRRGQHAAYAALCASYTKILRVNLTTDSYQIICMDPSERTAEKGFAEQISVWLHDFGTSGQVHPEDLAIYLKKTEISYLRSYFADQKRSINIFYRRLIGSVYRQAMMELIIAEDYADDHQSLYLYVKDIDR